MSRIFIMACLRDNVGSNTAFHASEGRGYITDIDKAEKYTKEEAQRYWDGAREFDLPLDFKQVEAQAIYKVDMQFIPNSTVIDGLGKYAAFKKGRYDGNDVYWMADNGEVTTDFSKAHVLNYPLDNDFISIPYFLAECRQRRTFDHSKINKRKMVQGAGLVTPKHIKRQSRRVENAKKMFNCEGCGRISWQHNPYDFEGCKNESCIEFKHDYSASWFNL